MTMQHSFSKIENALLPGYRNKIAAAESTEDVKKFYNYTMLELFNQVFSGNLDAQYDEITLRPDEEPPYVLSDRLLNNDDFSSVWKSSDLARVVSRFADTAAKRYKHLKKNPEKTEAKIRM